MLYLRTCVGAKIAIGQGVLSAKRRRQACQRLAAVYYEAALICQRAGGQMTYRAGQHRHLIIRVDATRSTTLTYATHLSQMRGRVRQDGRQTKSIQRVRTGDQ